MQPVTPTATSEASDLSTTPLEADFTRAAVAGLVWTSSAALVPDLTGADFGRLAVGASLTQLLFLLASSAVSRDPKRRARIAFSAALLTVSAFALGSVLKAYTHHRPLGAVTWVLISLGLMLPIGALARRFQGLVGQLIALGLLASVAWLARASLSVGVSVQLVAGAACCAAAVVHRARRPGSGAKLGWPALALMAVGWVLVLHSGDVARLSEQAPLLLGVIGLLH